MCDVESYCYLPMLEELDYIPKHKYSFAPEIMEHSKNVATHYRLYDNALLSTGVAHTEWDDKTGRWTITTDRGLDGLTDKRVGIIGTGATAVQCVPHLGDAAKELYVFQRTPSPVDVRNNRETPPDFLEGQETGWQCRRMDNFNKLVTGADQDEDLVNDGWTDIFRKLTGIAAKTASKELGRRLTRHERAELMEMDDYRKMETVRRRAQEIVDDPDVAESLKPDYRQFCKRPCFHDEYLPTFNRPNVHLVDTDGQGVERFTETGLVANGEHIELDCIIFATGFEVGTSYVRRAGYDTVGRACRHLSEKWKDGLRTVHGLQTEGFPNAFFMGFNQGAVTVNIPQTLNEQAV